MALWLGIASAAQTPGAVQVPGASPPVAVTKPSKPITKATSKKRRSRAAKRQANQKPRTAKRPSSRPGKSKKAAGPRGQLRPTPERYKQIEEALAARGYLSEEPNGKWTPASVDALRSFQNDHDLPPTGRLDALSLIALGLGPKQQ